MEFRLVYTLPNLKLSRPFNTQFISIVPFSDAKIKMICAESQSASKLINCFVDVTREKVEPAVLLLSVNAPLSVRTNEAIASFRNIIAISAIVRAWADIRPHEKVPEPLFSNVFDFFPLTVDLTGGFQSNTYAFNAYFSENTPLICMPSISVPQNSTNMYDVLIYDYLLKIWDLLYVNEYNDKRYARIMRSLEIAYHALSIPIKNESTIFDVGVNIALWVSAIEILVNPGGSGYVDLHKVVDFLEKYQTKNVEVEESLYEYRRSKKEPNYQINIIQKIYVDLYKARNDFLHGNDVAIDNLFLFKNKANKDLLLFAPVIYRVALRIFIDDIFDIQRLPGDYFVYELPYEDCLSQIVK